MEEYTLVLPVDSIDKIWQPHWFWHLIAVVVNHLTSVCGHFRWILVVVLAFLPEFLHSCVGVRVGFWCGFTVFSSFPTTLWPLTFEHLNYILIQSWDIIQICQLCKLHSINYFAHWYTLVHFSLKCKVLTGYVHYTALQNTLPFIHTSKQVF